ncbi:aminopeptidase [Nafulsella turpanensis]|uniref:aminopeptidase n=1 Tax=Nafulsella turpanensis TaxID=1265690 RepID=UPI0003494F08|nr:aminopeptidase [Nafulsella turpanensis]
MRSIIRRVLLGLLLVMVILVVWQWPLINYGIMQGKGQFEVLWNARDVEEVLKDPQVPDSLKQKLLLVQEVRDFAVDSLGVSESENYTTLYDQQGEDILWVVTAVKPYSLKQKQWTFPVVGTVSYKGYFDYERALKEQAELAAEGYDTYLRSVGAWSTLGWFQDPILSNMLFRGDGNLINTIIHELTHATIFVKDSLDFNENLATFVGHEGALRFITHKWGPDAELLETYQENYRGRHLFSEHMLRGLRQLGRLYESFPEGMPVAEKEAAKQDLINEIIAKTDTLPIENASGYRKYLEEKEPNNALFMSYDRYRGEQEALAKQFEEQFDGDIEQLLEYYKEQFGR